MAVAKGFFVTGTGTAAGSQQSDDEVAPYRYGLPASPHLAAAQAGETIDPERLRARAQSAAAGADVLVCEGVGGLLVPLSWRLGGAMRDQGAQYLVRDLAVDLELPMIVAASPGLGTINHTLLTLESARAAGLRVAAVVLTPWPAEPSAIERSNLETIESVGEVTVLTLPQLNLAAPDTSTITSRLPGVSSTSKPASAAIAATSSGPFGSRVASSRARATSPRTALAM